MDLNNLDDVPSITDFYLTLREHPEGGLHIEMMSRTRGHLAGFPAWDHADRDLRHFTHDDIPIGTDDEPFEDADEAWRIVILGVARAARYDRRDRSFRADLPCGASDAALRGNDHVTSINVAPTPFRLPWDSRPRS